MPSNKEIINDIQALAAELGEPTPNTDGANNEKLLNIARDLRQRLKAAPSDEEAEVTETEEAEVTETEEAEVTETEEAEATPVVVNGYVVAKGKSITSKKGILDAGTPVEPDHLNGGVAAFQRLRDRKVIVKA